MFGRKKVEIISEDSVCWNQEQYMFKKWADTWADWARIRNTNPSPKVTETYWNAHVKADKELKAYVERTHG